MMKMNRLSRVLAAMLTLVMVVGAFAGCGAKKPDEELIVGKWETAIDFQKAMEQGMEAGDAETLAELDLSGISLKMTAEFKADGTYTLEADKESAETAMTQLAEKMVPALKELVRQQIAEASEIKAEDVTDEMLDSMLAFFGVQSWDDLGAALTEEMDSEELIKEISTAGKYLLKEGKLYLSEDADSDPAAQEGIAYTLNKKTLTLKAEEGEDVPDFMQEMVFNRVG